MWITKLVLTFYHGHLTNRPVFRSRQWTMLSTRNDVVVGLGASVALGLGVSNSVDVTFDVGERRQHLGDGRLLTR